jgi:hypothetical protein
MKKLNELLSEYISYAEQHGEAIAEGNYKIANKSHDKLLKTLMAIRQYKTEGCNALLKLTDHEKDAVRGWAAIHSLKYDTEKSEKVLEEITKKKGIISFSAEMALKEWKKGTLEIP